MFQLWRAPGSPALIRTGNETVCPASGDASAAEALGTVLRVNGSRQSESTPLACGWASGFVNWIRAIRAKSSATPFPSQNSRNHLSPPPDVYRIRCVNVWKGDHVAAPVFSTQSGKVRQEAQRRRDFKSTGRNNSIHSGPVRTRLNLFAILRVLGVFALKKAAHDRISLTLSPHRGQPGFSTDFIKSHTNSRKHSHPFVMCDAHPRLFTAAEDSRTTETVRRKPFARPSVPHRLDQTFRFRTQSGECTPPGNEHTERAGALVTTRCQALRILSRPTVTSLVALRVSTIIGAWRTMNS